MTMVFYQKNLTFNNVDFSQGEVNALCHHFNLLLELPLGQRNEFVKQRCNVVCIDCDKHLQTQAEIKNKAQKCVVSMKDGAEVQGEGTMSENTLDKAESCMKCEPQQGFCGSSHLQAQLFSLLTRQDGLGAGSATICSPQQS